jgi:hypothetical protein
MRSFLKVVVAMVTMCMLFAGPSRAGDAEVALLRPYIGNWAGSGVLVGGDQPERFSCRLKITQARLVKINYAGRCTLVNMNLSVSGTIGYNDKQNRYEATMRSNVGFSAAAVGQQRGKHITFILRERQNDRGGNSMEVGSAIVLDGNRITVDFNVEFNRSGQVLTTTVPFQRQ